MDELADDGNPFDDDPNGGGVDITDEVLAKLQNEWQESKHPRDKDGKFGTGGGAQDTITVRGNELGGHNMTKEELRAAAVDYYKKNLAGTSVKHPELGEIHFSMGGYKKPISFSADERKLKLFPFLPEIIKQSEVIEEDTDKRGRRNMKAYRVVASTVTLKGEKLRVRVSLREDDNGNLYYDHVIAQKKSQGKRSNPATNPGEISQGVNNSITLPELVVNLFFDGE